MSTPFRLRVPRRFVAEMIAHAQAELPNECCGLLAGQELSAAGAGQVPLAEVACRYPLVNAAASPREYRSSERSMFAAHKDMMRQGLHVLAVYHSHPTAAPVPSRRDLERNYSSDVVNFIISLETAEPQIRGWWLTEQEYHEAEWDSVD